jgi:hypothetical protein
MSVAHWKSGKTRKLRHYCRPAGRHAHSVPRSRRQSPVHAGGVRLVKHQDKVMKNR